MRHPTGDLSALLDGELPADRAEEIRRHLSACAACAAEERRLRGAVSLLGALPPAPEPSPFFAARLEARLRAAPPRAGWVERLRGQRWRLAVPAGGLAAAALAVSLSLQQTRSSERALAKHLDLLENLEAVASLGELDTPEDVLVVAELDELERQP